MRDLHTHTTYSDGENTPEEMVLSAIAMGLDAIGFSDHSYTFFDESYCMPQTRIDAYRQEIEALKSRYAGQIRIYCGIEQDYYSHLSPAGYDYVIGSVHYIRVGDVYIPVDETPEILRDAAQQYFGGDFYALAECYYETVADVVRKTGADIIGHFDLIRKFSECASLLDPHHPRYVAAWQQAADALLPAGVPFEINTGAMAKGYRTVPYPDDDIRCYLRARGGRFLLSGDSHSAKTLCYRFADWQAECSPPPCVK